MNPLEFGSYFDWFTPTLGFIQDIFKGPVDRFGVELAGWSGRDVERLLLRNGVHCWGLMVVDDTIIFNVRRSQGRFAQRVMEQARVPLIYMPYSRP